MTNITQSTKWSVPGKFKGPVFAASIAAVAFLSKAFFSNSSSTTCQSESSTAFNMADHKQNRINAIWGLFAADALSMPVHWYYNPDDIKRGYDGWLTGYRAPNKKHPSSILTLSATDGSGRNGWHSKSKQVVGNIILHDKLKYWTSGNSGTHYHQGMAAGDNTLNALIALQTFKILQKVDSKKNKPMGEVRQAVLENYVKFMTTPGSHNDTYAESCHRLFFKDWINLDDPPKDGAGIIKFCQDRYNAVKSEDSQIPVIGAIPIAIPWIIYYSDKSVDECAQTTVEALKLTHPAPSLMKYIDLYARMLHAVINGSPLKDQVLQALSSSVIGSRKKDTILKISEQAKQYHPTSDKRLRLYQEATYMLGSACYIDGAMASMLFFANEFHDDFSQGILTNTNCGGENVHRGAALGALLAANAHNVGKDIPQRWIDGLHSAKSGVEDVVKLI